MTRGLDCTDSTPESAPRILVVWTDLVLLVSILAGSLMVIFRNDLLPSRFFYDGLFIQALAQGLVPTQNDVAYGNVGLVYRSLGLQDNANLASLVGFSLFVAILLILRAKYPPSASTIVTSFFLASFILIGAIYIGYYSKDAILLLVVLAIAGLGRTMASEMIIVGSMLFYAGFFRSYWFIIACLYILIRLYRRFWPDKRGLLMAALVASVVVGLAVSLVLDTTPDYFRLAVNESRAGNEDAGSMIHPFIPSSSLPAGLVNVALTLVSLVLPFPLALSGGLYYLVLSAYIAFLWVTFYRSVPRYGPAAPTSVRNVLGARTLALVTAVLITQSIFEPDYGSALRHISPLMPLLACTIWSAQKSRQICPRTQVSEAIDRKMPI